MGDERSTEVKIGDTNYSLVEPPSKDSQIVKDERGQLLKRAPLNTFVQDLCNVGYFVRLAYHGLVATGPEFTQMQLDVQDLGYDVTRLCDKSAIAVSNFKRASSTIVTDLQATYEYLLDNLEELALDTLASVSQLAGEMAKMAKALENDFDLEAKKVRDVAKRATIKKHEKIKLSQEKEAEKATNEEEKKKQQQVLTETMAAEKEAERWLTKYECEENEAIGEIAKLVTKDDFLTRLGHLFTRTSGIEYVREEREKRERVLDEWKEKKREALKRRQELEEKRQETYQTMSDLTKSIQNCRDIKNMSENTVKALHQATEGLNMLAALMMHTARFWEQMQDHCKSLGESEVKQRVEKAMTFDEARRRKAWTCRGFKLQAVRFYAGWVALDDVCDDYLLQIREAQRTLYQYITENPTWEEAERSVKALANEFSKMLAEEQKRISEEKKKTQKALSALE